MAPTCQRCYAVLASCHGTHRADSPASSGSQGSGLEWKHRWPIAEPAQLRGTLPVILTVADSITELTNEGALHGKLTLQIGSFREQGPAPVLQRASTAQAPRAPTATQPFVPPHRQRPPGPLLGRSVTDAASSNPASLAAADVMETWDLPTVELHSAAGVSSYYGEVRLGHLEGLRMMVGRTVMLILAVDVADGATLQFCSQAFTLGSSMPVLLAFHTAVAREISAPARLYAMAAAAAIIGPQSRSIQLAAYLHSAVLECCSNLLPGINAPEAMQCLADVVTGVEGTVQFVACAVAIGQAAAVHAQGLGSTRVLWDLIAKVAAQLEGDETVKELLLRPGLSDDKVQAAMVERTLRNFATYLVEAEATLGIPTYSTHRTLTIFPKAQLHYRVRMIKWPRLEKVAETLAGLTLRTGSRDGTSQPPRLERAASVMKSQWCEAHEYAIGQARAVIGAGALVDLLTDMRDSAEVMTPHAGAERRGLLMETKIAAEVSLERVLAEKAQAQETLSWIAEIDKEQGARVSHARQIRTSFMTAGEVEGLQAVVEELMPIDPDCIVSCVHELPPQAQAPRKLIAVLCYRGSHSEVVTIMPETGTVVPMRHPEWFRIDSADAGQTQKFALAVLKEDASILIANAERNQLYRMNRSFDKIEIYGGTGARGQTDATLARASFSGPCELLALPSGVIIVGELGHPETIRVLEEGAFTSVPMPLAKKYKGELTWSFAEDVVESDAAWIATQGALFHLQRVPASGHSSSTSHRACPWQIKRLHEVRGVHGLVHLHDDAAGLNGLLLSLVEEYKIAFLDLDIQPIDGKKPKLVSVAGRAMSRGIVNGSGPEARFSKPGKIVRFADGSLSIGDYGIARRLLIGAEMAGKTQAVAAELGRCADLARQRADPLGEASRAALALLSGLGTRSVALQRALQSASFTQEVQVLLAAPRRVTFRQQVRLLVVQAPSLRVIANMLSSPSVAWDISGDVLEAIAERLESYDWPLDQSCREEDLRAVTTLLHYNVLQSSTSVCKFLDNGLLPLRACFDNTLIQTLEAIATVFPAEPSISRSMFRLALRRFTRYPSLSERLKVAREQDGAAALLQGEVAQEDAQRNAFVSWLLETLAPLDAEMSELQDAGPLISWLLTELFKEHLIGENDERRIWTLSACGKLLSSLAAPVVVAALRRNLRSAVSKLTLRKVAEGLGILPNRRFSMESPSGEPVLVLELLQAALPRDTSNVRGDADLARLDELAWASVIKFVDGEEARSSLQASPALMEKLHASTGPVRVAFEALVQSVESGHVAVTTIQRMVRRGMGSTMGEAAEMSCAGRLRSDGLWALEVLGEEGCKAAARVRSLHEELLDVHACLTGLTRLATRLWPTSSTKSLLCQACDRWETLASADALAIFTDAKGVLAAINAEVLRAAAALSSLSASSSFAAVWETLAVVNTEDSEEKHLRRAASWWKDIFDSLGQATRQHARLKAVELEIVADMLRNPAELRALALTSGIELTEGAISSWSLCEISESWESEASDFIERFCHAAALRQHHAHVQRILETIAMHFVLGSEAEAQVKDVLAELASLQRLWEAWPQLPVSDSESDWMLVSRIDARLLQIPLQVMESLGANVATLEWLRKFADDADYLVRVEVAMGRPELETPDELWSTENGRVDEQKVGDVTAVRTALHDILYRPTLRYENFEDAISDFAALGSHINPDALAAAIDATAGLRGPLSRLLSGGADAVADRLSQLLCSSNDGRQAVWRISPCESQGIDSIPRACGTLSADERLLQLEYRSASSLSVQNLPELLDFQAAVTLSSSGVEVSPELVDSFTEQLGLARLAATTLDKLRSAGHPSHQRIDFEFELSRPVAELRAAVASLQDQLSAWHSSLKHQRIATSALNYLFAAQLGALLNHFSFEDSALGFDNLTRVLKAIVSTWGLAVDESTWGRHLERQWHDLSKKAVAVSTDVTEALRVFSQAWSAAWHDTVKLDARPSLESVVGADVPVGADLTKGLHIACLEEGMVEAVALPYISGKQLPRRDEVLLCYDADEATLEAVELFILRWSQSMDGSRFTLGISMRSGFGVQQAAVRAIHEAMDRVPKPPCPLLVVIVGENSSRSHVSSQLAAHRVELTLMPAAVYQAYGMALSRRTARNVRVYRGDHSGTGKSFAVRLSSSREMGPEAYRLVRVSCPVSAADLAMVLRAAASVDAQLEKEQVGSCAVASTGGILLHFDLVAAKSFLESDAFGALLFDLLLCGRISSCGCQDDEAIFVLDPSRVAVAFEVPAGIYPSVLGWLPQVDVAASLETFRSDAAALQVGMGPRFTAPRHDGLRGLAAPSNAYERLQYVCRALRIQRKLRGAFPLQFDHASGAEELLGSECFQLLVSAAGLSLRPSLWNLWAFVDVLFWQLREVHHPDSVVNQACVPEDYAEDSAAREMEAPEACPPFKGELISFVARTVKDFATRQVANEDVDPDDIVAAELKDVGRFSGTWSCQDFSSDGQPVFALWDKCGVSPGHQYFLYYRAVEDRWVIDEYADKVAPAWAWTKGSQLQQGWMEMAKWELNKLMKVKQGHDATLGACVEVTGVDEHLKGTDDEYCPPLNGKYLKQPPSENINGQPHYVLEEPRRHLFYDLRSGWCIAHVCHADEGVYARCLEALEGCYLTMGRDRPLPGASVKMVTAKEAAAGAARSKHRQRRGNQVAGQQDDDGHTTPAETTEEEFALKSWEACSHDCLLFSNRRHAVSLLSSNPKRLRNSMHPGLVLLLERNGVQIGEPLDSVNVDRCHILGCLTDVDRSSKEAAELLDGRYCLTGDAVLKMLAIFVRLRCGLPVVLMGECGCGKTQMVRYLTAWLNVDLLTLNVHGGTTEADIDSIFSQATSRALEVQETGRVIIFLDEVNTSQHVHLLCEALLYRSLRGKPLPDNVDVMAALNPHRLRPAEAAPAGGLVYNAGSGAEAKDMSNLVYRVHAVPETVHDFLFDFGALTDATEESYVEAMVRIQWPSILDRELRLMTTLLCIAQTFIRTVDADSSSVSLRDVKRCLQVAIWVQRRYAIKHGLSAPHPASVIIALGIVYQYRLPDREQRSKLWNTLSRQAAWPQDRGAMRGRGWVEMSDANAKPAQAGRTMERILQRAQQQMVKEFEVDADIVINEALAENLFVGFICIMNQIPLFIVGKPGTSKTLCMQVLLSNIQGLQSRSKAFQDLPALRVIQYQCSPLSTAEGIKNQFEAAQRFAHSAMDQRVVFLMDEVGLAEFSPDMPLKVLHGILAEPGEVAVVGLSNWRLDPAKMNRSVCLTRPDPDSQEVGRTGAGLLGTKHSEESQSSATTAGWLQSVAEAFWSVFSSQGGRDWLGMRDYYSFLRSLRGWRTAAAATDELPSAEAFAVSAARNFGGKRDLLDQMLEAVLEATHPGTFRESLAPPLKKLLRDSLTDASSRHLLIACDGPAVSWLRASQVLPRDVQVLVGSDFNDDTSEAFAVRQLIKVRDAMAKGLQLVLWQTDAIYEALYDVLNQRFVRRKREDGTQEKMLRLAIGARSQLCPVVDGFKLVIVVEVDRAHTQLDVPFLNRFEKQMLEPEDLISQQALEHATRLKAWVDQLSAEAACEAIVGFHAGTAAALVMSYPDAGELSWKRMLLEMASPLAVLRSSMLEDAIASEGSKSTFFERHDSLASALNYLLAEANEDMQCDIFTSSPAAHLRSALGSLTVAAEVLALAELSSEQQLTSCLVDFFESGDPSAGLLIIQVDHLADTHIRTHLAKQRYADTRRRLHGQQLPSRHVCFVTHHVGWPTTSPKHAFVWRPEPGWRSVFIDDLCGQSTGEDVIGLEDALTRSVHSMVDSEHISITSFLQERWPSILARCVLPADDGRMFAEADAEVFSHSLRSQTLAQAITEPKFLEGVRVAALQVLQRWASPDTSGLHTQVRLAMRELRSGSLRRSLHVAIDRLVVAALAIAVRWLDSDFNLHHLRQGASIPCRRLFMQLLTEKAIMTAPQLAIAAASQSAFAGSPMPSPNNGRHGMLVSKCPFSARLLAVLRTLQTGQMAHEGAVASQLHARCQILLADSTLQAFCDFEKAHPGAFLEDAVQVFAPQYPGLNVTILQQLYQVLHRVASGGVAIQSPLEAVSTLLENSHRTRAYCSLLSLLAQHAPQWLQHTLAKLEEASAESAATTGNGNDQSKNRISMFDAAAVCAFVETCRCLSNKLQFVVAARLHVPALLQGADQVARSEGLPSAWMWWHLQLAQIVEDTLESQSGQSCHCFALLDDIVEKWASHAGCQLHSVKMWSEVIARARQKEELTAWWVLWHGVSALVGDSLDRTSCQDAEAIGFLESLWRLLAGEAAALADFGLQGIEVSEPAWRGLLGWLLMRLHLLPVVPAWSPELLEAAVAHYDDLAIASELHESHISDLVPMASGSSVAPMKFLSSVAAARVSISSFLRCLAEQASMRLELTPPSVTLQGLFSKVPAAAMYAAKVARSLGGDELLCQLGSRAGKRQLFESDAQALSWLPFAGEKIPDLEEALPDPFVYYSTSAEVYKALRGAVGVCITSGAASGAAMADIEKTFIVSKTQRSAVSILAAAASQISLHRDIATSSGIKALQDSLGSLQQEELVSRILSQGELLPCVTEARGWVKAGSGPPKGLVEQIAAHLILLVAADKEKRHSAKSSSSTWVRRLMTMSTPKELKAEFWPSMPDDERDTVLGAMGFVGWYTCRNGHPYSVGECTRPMQLGRCPVPGCGLPIGGEDHESVAGTKRVEQASLAGKALTGYVTAVSDLIDNTLVNQALRPFSMAGLKVFRIIIHVALWVSLGSTRWFEGARMVCGSSNPTMESAVEVLYRRIAEDWDELCKSTRMMACHSSRELCVLIHTVLMRAEFPVEFRTKSSRNAFEGSFQSTIEWILRKGPSAVDDSTAKLQVMMQSKVDYTSALRTVMGKQTWQELCDVATDDTRTEGNEVFDAASSSSCQSLPVSAVCWRGRKALRLKDCEALFRNFRENAQQYPLVATVFQHRHRLATLPVLPAVMAWHAILYEAFEDGALTRDMAHEITNADAIARLPDHRQALAEEVLARYCDGFNLAFPLVERLFECQANPFLRDGEVHLPGPMTSRTPVCFSLPFVAQSGETDAPFLCTVQLINILQTAQNELLDTLFQTGAKLESSEASQTGGSSSSSIAPRLPGVSLEAVYITADTDPAVITSALVTVGSEQSLAHRCHCYRAPWQGQEYNYQALQQSLWRDLRGASRIQVQLRHYRFAGEMRSSGRLALLRERVPQESLPNWIVEALHRDISKRGSEAWGQLRGAVEDLIHFSLSVAASGISGSLLLTQLAKATGGNTGILDGLSPVLTTSLNASHLQALYLEAESGPGGGSALALVALAYRQEMHEAVLTELNQAIATAAQVLMEWLPVLHDLLTEQLGSERWPATAVLRDFLGFAVGEEPPECMPETLQLQHAFEVYRYLSAHLHGK